MGYSTCEMLFICYTACTQYFSKETIVGFVGFRLPSDCLWYVITVANTYHGYYLEVAYLHFLKCTDNPF